MTQRDWLVLACLDGMAFDDPLLAVLLRELSEDGLQHFRRHGNGGVVLSGEGSAAFDEAVFRAYTAAGLGGDAIARALFPAQITFH